jgi:hypothetical protein
MCQALVKAFLAPYKGRGLMVEMEIGIVSVWGYDCKKLAQTIIF